MHARSQLPLTEEQRQLAADHLQLARDFAGLHYSPHDRRYADVEGICVDEMLYATRKYDPSRGASFSTYAKWWMRRGIGLYRIRTARLRLSLACELSEDDQNGQPLVFQRPSRIPSPSRVAATRELVELCRRLLTPREWEILYRRYILGEEQGEIGESWGVSSQRIGQLERAALARLRQKLAHHVEEVML